MVITVDRGPALRKHELRFGSFRLIPGQRLLLNSGKQVRIGNRALDVLIALIERAGSVVTKEELIAWVWPNTIVEDISLRVNIAALRRALGEAPADHRYIANVAGRGYSFVAKVTCDAIRQRQVASATKIPRNYDSPVQATKLVGREPDLKVMTELLGVRRLVSILGAAGVGKSTLALAVGARLLSNYPDGVRFVALGAISDPALVPHSLAAHIGVTVSADDPLRDLVTFLKGKRMLIVLDNCEHVITAAATLTEAILKGARQLQILATSREPLSAEGEWRHRLSPLKVPFESSSLTAAVAREYTAIQLFMERAASNTPAFALSDANAPTVAHICRQLDGIPLAIELAAARVNFLGVRELAVRLDDQLFIASGRRTAVPRHQTLQAALDWSYGLLDQTEQVILRRLSAFKGSFTLESAVDLAARRGLSADSILDGLLTLADKSLITTDISDNIAHYRLLHTTCAYAFDKLSNTDERMEIGKWHAESMAKFFRRAEADWEDISPSQWVSKYGYAIDDVRSAIDWAFSPSGDVALGAALTVASVPFGYQLALIEEFRRRVERALARLSDAPTLQPLIKSRLINALEGFNQNTGNVPWDQEGSRATAEEIAGKIDIAKYQIGPILQRTTSQIEDGKYREALNTAERLSAVAKETGDPLATLIADRVLAQAQHFDGNHAAARSLAERVLGQPARSVPLAYVPMQVDLRVSMRIVLSRTLWLLGFADQAVHVADESLDHADSDSPFSRCQALALAGCPIAFWRGDIFSARLLVTALLTQATRYRLGHWQAYGEHYKRLIAAGERNGQQQIRFPSSLAARPKGLILDTLATIAPGYLEPELPEAVISGAVGWSAPEMLRIQGERVLKERGSHAESQAESLFQKSLEIASTHNALAWKLRTAMSLAHLWHRQRRTTKARKLACSVYAQFTEGHESRDLRRARTLIKNLS